ncbi:MAG TPA: DUF4097 family beta strand repeat-containing protein [Actinopolymorphaceae bacterium]|nr:DUF4097 family beta strand repeat-containing protein [Actinopolymorphaceae bacterium]
MPTFQTPEPVTLRVRLSSGDLHVTASARTDTEVEVRPGNERRSEDVEAAQNTLVEHRNGTIVIEMPDGGRRSFGRSPSIDVRVGLPEGSHLRGAVASADVTVDGRAGDVEITSASGDVRLDRTADLVVQTASGDFFGREVDGDAKAQTASGDISLLKVAGEARLSTASGDAELNEAGGDVRLQSASGDLHLGRAGGSVEVKTASGDVRVDVIHQGEFTGESASGDIHVGIAAGTAAWLDVSSLSGDVRSALDQSGEPGGDEQRVSVRARTLSGDITVARAR